MDLRLRQIALVARDLAAARADIGTVFGLDWSYADPNVGKYGLDNAVFPIGTTFLEVVSPVTAGTTAGRLLDKRGGDGGYMVILQTQRLAEARARAVAAGARIVDQRDGEGVAFTHFHPRDVGGAILSIDYMDPPDRWDWGGPGWGDHVAAEKGLAIIGAELQADVPEQMAARWAEVLGGIAERQGDGWRIGLGEGELRFVPVADSRGEGLRAFDVTARDVQAIRDAVEDHSLIDAEGRICLCGTQLNLVQR